MFCITFQVKVIQHMCIRTVLSDNQYEKNRGKKKQCLFLDMSGAWSHDKTMVDAQNEWGNLCSAFKTADWHPEKKLSSDLQVF